MAPVAADDPRRESKPKDRIDMIADITKTGKLIEGGCDPFTHAPETKAEATQTEGSGTKILAGYDGGPSTQAHKALEMILANKEVVKSTDSPASQVLRLVVGMLGMEVHEQPSSWAESWLTFQDQTFASLGLGTKKSSRKDSDLSQDSPAEWQMSVLEHLREHVDARTQENSVQEPITGVQAHGQENGHDWGPDFMEHLDLAEFALRRITYAVGVLEDPEKHDRPILLREYTEEMVLKVAKDLRQWLHQLGSLLSLYHVHLLDLEADRRRLAKQLDSQVQKFNNGEEEQKEKVRSCEVYAAKWEEEKMRRDAERLLGIQLGGEDAKIYSQNDVDEMYKQWEKEHLDPLLAELNELRAQVGDYKDKLRDGKGKVIHRQGEDTGGESMGKGQVAMMVGIVDAASERVPDDALSRLLSRFAEDVARGSHNLAEILADVNALPMPKAAPSAMDMMNSVDEGDHPALNCLDTLTAQFQLLEAEARKCPSQNGADKLTSFAAWARESATMVRGSIVDGGKVPLRSPAPPKWDLGILSKMQSAPPVQSGATTAGAGAGDSEAIRQAVTDEFNLKMNRLRRELEAKLRAAVEAAERERENAREALERLAEESAKADATMAELRRKIQMLEALLKKQGLGKQVDEAFHGAGLSEFMNGKDVFERLYRDAMDRMRRLAESQAKFFEETSADFLRSIGQIMSPNLRLPGLASGALPSHGALVTENMVSSRLGSAPAPRPRPRPQATDAYSMPRSAGGALPTRRSVSPPSSPSHATDSFTSPRPVQSAPSRIGDTFSVARLLTPAAIAATPHQKGMRQKSENRLQMAALAQGLAHAQAQRTREPGHFDSVAQRSPGTGLSINSASLPPGANDGVVQRPASQQTVSQRTRPLTTGYGSGHADSTTLPPLECRGQGRSRSPSNDDNDARMSRLRGVRAAPPTKQVTSDRDRLDHVRDLLSSKDPLLSIGSLGPSGGPAPPSGLLPPEMHQRGPSSGKTATGRPATHSGVGRMSRQGAALSMPNLGPPRLLVQSVGAAY